RPILAAGLELPTPDAGAAESGDDHPHSEAAWRLRHIKRSILKESGEVVSITDAASEQSIPPATPSLFGGAFASAASMAASFFTNPPFSGELNLLTTSAFAPGQQVLSGDLLTRGVAYVSIGAPMAG